MRFRLTTATHGTIHLVEVDGVTHRVSLDEGGVIRSPAPALVVATPLAVGDEVEANAPILVLCDMWLGAGENCSPVLTATLWRLASGRV